MKPHWLSVAYSLSGKHINKLTPSELGDYWRLRLAGYLSNRGNIIVETI